MAHHTGIIVFAPLWLTCFADWPPASKTKAKFFPARLLQTWTLAWRHHSAMEETLPLPHIPPKLTQPHAPKHHDVICFLAHSWPASLLYPLSTHTSYSLQFSHPPPLPVKTPASWRSDSAQSARFSSRFLKAADAACFCGRIAGADGSMWPRL